MGFHCCSLKVWTTTAVIYSIVNYLVFTSADFFILLSIVSPVTLETNESNQWNQFVNRFKGLENPTILTAILLLRLVIRLFVIIAVPVLSIGNRKDRRKYLVPWEMAVALYAALVISSSIYFLIVENKNNFVDSFPDWIRADLASMDTGTITQWARFTVFLNLSDGGPLLILWLILLGCVHLRCVQIRFEKGQLQRLGRWDTNILTYRIPRARLNSMDPHGTLDSTLEMRSSRIPAYPASILTNNTPDSHTPFYDNQAFKY